MPKQRILCVVGTRPEAVKVAPVVEELRRFPGEFETRVLATAQHREMLDQVLGLFGIRPDADLNLMREGHTLTEVTTRVLSRMEEFLAANPQDVVLAQGDTTTVLATALSCYYLHVRFGHVEAGLRTGNPWAPYPEEFNRRAAGVVATYHFAPTRSAASNLHREGVDPRSIHVVGNTVIDALLQVLRRTTAPASPIPAGAPYVLMTCHRREIFGEKIREVFHAVRDFARKRPGVFVWYPVHPNPNVSKPAHEILDGLPNVRLTAPLDYVAFVHAMNGARLMLSDSGGVQEEAPTLGKPVLVLRDVTERPEGIEAGTCRLVGPHRDRILAALDRLLDDAAEYDRMAQARNPYGDGKSAGRIVAILGGRDRSEWQYRPEKVNDE